MVQILLSTLTALNMYAHPPFPRPPSCPAYPAAASRPLEEHGAVKRPCPRPIGPTF